MPQSASGIYRFSAMQVTETHRSGISANSRTAASLAVSFFTSFRQISRAGIIAEVTSSVFSTAIARIRVSGFPIPKNGASSAG